MREKFFEIFAAFLFFSNYALAAASVFFCLRLFRQSRNYGWLFLAGAFITPFFFAFARTAHGLPLLNYRSYVLDAQGRPKMSVNLDFPCFYLAVALGLWLILRAARKKS